MYLLTFVVREERTKEHVSPHGCTGTVVKVLLEHNGH